MFRNLVTTLGLAVALALPVVSLSASPSQAAVTIGDRSTVRASAVSYPVCGQRVRQWASATRYARASGSTIAQASANANRVSTRMARSAAVKAARAKANRYAKSHRSTSCRKAVVRKAAALRGRPYVWGASGPRAFDCSGYTRYVYKKTTGRSLPRTSSAQAHAGKRVRHPGLGDLVVFHSGGRVYHVAIYAGGNQVWHSPRPGQSVKKERIWTSSRYFVRLV